MDYRFSEDDVEQVRAAAYDKGYLDGYSAGSVSGRDWICNIIQGLLNTIKEGVPSGKS